MDFFVLEQIQIFWYAVICGIFIGILNEPFRFMRYAGFSTKAEVFIQDILLMSICGTVTFFFSLCYNHGNVRFFIVVGETAGFVLFRYTAGLLSGKLFGCLFWIVKKVFSGMKAFISIIFTRMTKILVWLLVKIPLFRKKSKIACNKGKFYCIIAKSVNAVKR